MAFYAPAVNAAPLFAGEFFPPGFSDVDLSFLEMPFGLEPVAAAAAAAAYPYAAYHAQQQQQQQQQQQHHAAAQALSGDETGDSSAASPSSASPGPEVPILGSAGSPVSAGPTTTHEMESKNEMVAAALPKRVEGALAAASNKRKASSPRPEADTKAVVPVQQMSKRARANARNQKREAHNQAERERRDELKEGFAGLRMALPTNLAPDRKNMVDLLHAAIDYIRELQNKGDRLEAQVSGLRQAGPAAH